MWKYICPLLIALGLASCHSSKEATSTEKVVTGNYTLPDSLSASPAFRMFWNDWTNEMQQMGVTLAEYTPSQELAQRYNLRTNNESYCLTGFLHTHDNFVPEQLTELGGNCVAYAGGIYTFSIPVKALPQFITLPGIKYIESSSPVHMR